ncbi:hypothetical protein, partial [Plasticicumulans sp.]|uniref:hypothetical protein n=1 Tax=Plasticicumulans sp. TaxID=2307179 RepID=UPI002C0B1537
MLALAVLLLAAGSSAAAQMPLPRVDYSAVLRVSGAPAPVRVAHHALCRALEAGHFGIDALVQARGPAVVQHPRAQRRAQHESGRHRQPQRTAHRHERG